MYLTKPERSDDLSILQTGEEAIADANDAVVRGDFRTAYSKYSEAGKKFYKQKNSYGHAMATSYVAIMAIALDPQNPSTYVTAGQTLRSFGDLPLKLGLYNINSSQLADEVDLLGMEKDALAFNPGSPEDHKVRAKKLQDVAMGLRSKMSGKVLILPELFWKETIPGEMRALPLLAMAEESLGQSLVHENPKSAAEHFQTARLYWMQAGRQDMAQSASTNVQSYSLAVKCWFCGREVSGKDIHFVSMPATLTDLLMNSAAGTALPSFDHTNGEIYACKGCYGAIFNLADMLATQKTKELEVKINKQIDDIRRRLAMGPRI